MQQSYPAQMQTQYMQQGYYPYYTTSAQQAGGVRTYQTIPHL